MLSSFSSLWRGSVPHFSSPFHPQGRIIINLLELIRSVSILSILPYPSFFFFYFLFASLNNFPLFRVVTLSLIEKSFQHLYCKYMTLWIFFYHTSCTSFSTHLNKFSHAIIGIGRWKWWAYIPYMLSFMPRFSYTICSFL